MSGAHDSFDLQFWREPADIARALESTYPYLAWLDAGDGAATGSSYLAVPSVASVLLTASLTEATITRSAPWRAGSASETHAGDIFEALAQRMNAAASGHGGFRSGWLGWFSYELGELTVGARMHPAETPDAAFLWVDRSIECDHDEGTIRLWIRAGTDDAEAWVTETTELIRQARPSRETPRIEPPVSTRVRHNTAEYDRMIAACLETIRRGDAYQLCLTNRIDIDTNADPFSVYLRLRDSSPSHHGGFLRFGDVALLSASPEQFLYAAERRVATKPIKGTRPRSADAAIDANLAHELVSSEKERAENVMIVDLMRNDLGRIAEPGSVAVDTLLDVETYPHVHQLVSTVSATLAATTTTLDAVRACFPAGSMTGAPKLSAMNVLHDLEAGPRGIYSGAFGWIDGGGDLDLAMVIRSIVMTPGRASIGTGGGITAGSVPEDEIEETRIKARALLAALGASESWD